ncbi:MAG: AMP-binding protein [Myxococcaceae bacterium]
MSDPANDQASYSRGESAREHTAPLLTTTIGANLAHTAKAFPDRDALIDLPSGRRWTWRAFLADVRRLASGLLSAGLRPGDRIGIWSPNRWEWVLTQYAAAECGLVLVNINPAYRLHELEFVLNQSGTRAVIAARSYKDSDYAGMLAKVRGQCSALERVILMESPEWDELLQGPESDELARVAATLKPSDPINIQYTSGTTGFPKGATLSHSNLLNNGFFVGELLHYTEADRVCLPVPFYHCFGMVMGNLACTTHGAAMVLPSSTFDPAAALAAVQQERCTSLYGVPTMFIAELALKNFDDYDLSTLRTGIMAGSPCPSEIMRQVIDRMHMNEVSICYGMTETSPVSTQTRGDDSLERRVGTVGRVGPHLEVKIVDSEGRTVPRGVTGEFCTRGYSVMLGYWNQPELTNEVLDSDGWMHTGDLAVMDADGYVQITGRIKDMVIRGGENIYPREIEEFLYTHPDILDAQVIGVPDPKYGEELMAWVRMREGATPLTAEALRSWASGKLARQKIPRYVRVVDQFPMTVTGKVRKTEMRDESARLLGSDAGTR